jgi:molybdopterin molybdotransferase
MIYIYMISVQEAIALIDENTSSLPCLRINLSEAMGKVLAKDIYATVDIPSFAQSSMDGYAFSFHQWGAKESLLIKGEMAAGSSERLLVEAGNAARIFTGAPVPDGADTVVMQEKVEVRISEAGEKRLFIQDSALEAGRNVRPVGSEIKAGALAIEKLNVLTPAAIGFLAGIGISEVEVFPNPSIAIIVTGKELQQAGQPLGYGQVYESNSYTLRSALQQLRFNEISIYTADDELSILTETLRNALATHDIVLLTGGVSVGDYDFVLQAALNCGVERVFYKIKQRPGKPLYFGKKGDKLVFGLPGNPASVLTCFYEYVVHALSKLTHQPAYIKKIEVPLAHPLKKAVVLSQFLKAYYDGETVRSLDAQESYRLSSFAKANCLIKMDEQMMEYNIGEMVEVHLFPR